MGLNINNEALPMALHSKVLGLTLDPQVTCNAHIQNIATNAQKPLQVIKAFTGTTWGKQKATPVATYKAVMSLIHMVAYESTNCKSCRTQL